MTELSDSGGVGVELDLADKDTLEWERLFVEATFKVKEEVEAEALAENGMKIFLNAGRSFNDISSEAIFFDGFKMVGGYLLMFVYTAFMLGRFNRVEHRTYLTAAGIMAVAMGLALAYGVSAFFGLPYTPIHAILPFLCLGKTISPQQICFLKSYILLITSVVKISPRIPYKFLYLVPDEFYWNTCRQLH